MSPVSPAFICPPPLNVKDVIDCAVNSHVIVVTGHVEGTIKFNGPLLSKTKQKATVGGVTDSFFLIRGKQIWRCSVLKWSSDREVNLPQRRCMRVLTRGRFKVEQLKTRFHWYSSMWRLTSSGIAPVPHIGSRITSEAWGLQSLPKDNKGQVECDQKQLSY